MAPDPRSNAPLAAPPPRILAIANQKGGVGKTTTAINLGTALAAVGHRVLLIDLDPQGNASTGLAIRRERGRPTSYDLLLGSGTLAAARCPTAIPGLAIVPAGVDLSGAEVELVGLDRRHALLRNALTGSKPDALTGPEPADDFILIDCPPALGLLTINALVAADAVLVPLQCEFFALEGISHLVRTVERVRHAFNPGLHIQGIVLTMFDKRNTLSSVVEKDVRAHFGDVVYRTVIPRNVRVSEAPSHGRPVIVYDINCAGSRAYLHLASEVMRRERRDPPDRREVA